MNKNGKDAAETLRFQHKDGMQAVMEWHASGRIFWKNREVETDDALREMVREIHALMTG